MTKTLNITLPDGTKIIGTPEQVAKAIKAINGILPTGYYMSDSKGLVLISDMNDHHLKNAVLKLLRESAKKLSDADIEDIPDLLRGGPKDEQLLALAAEIFERHKRGVWGK